MSSSGLHMASIVTRTFSGVQIVSLSMMDQFPSPVAASRTWPSVSVTIST
jgi:hypothetical protein